MARKPSATKNRVEYHKESQVKDKAVKSFHVKKKSANRNSSNLCNVSLESNMPSQSREPAITDIVTILREMHSSQGMNVKEIRHQLIQRKLIPRKTTMEEVRRSIERGIRKRRISKIVEQSASDWVVPAKHRSRSPKKKEHRHRHHRCDCSSCTKKSDSCPDQEDEDDASSEKSNQSSPCRGLHRRRRHK
ncbi:hypothetical protein BgiMline_028520 [Biomphalaria glabrata]|nr:hypothetical protein BgiMline_014314 [Biomphalaria glabrata]